MTDNARHDRLIREHVHDPYRLRQKLHDPVVCPECGAVYHAGRWQWQEAAPEGAEEELCQACRRIKDHCPAGIVEVHGPFYAGHRDEIAALCRHQRDREQAEHPMNRIMEMVEEPDHMVVTTTDIHLSRSIGEALRHAYQGELGLNYEKEMTLLRVSWHR